MGEVPHTPSKAALKRLVYTNADGSSHILQTCPIPKEYLLYWIFVVNEQSLQPRIDCDWLRYAGKTCLEFLR